MPNRELEPHKLARLDQWNGFLNEVVSMTSHHLAVHCEKPAMACLGDNTKHTIELLEPVEREMLLEIAILRLAQTTPFVYEPSFHCWTPNRPGADPEDDDHDFSIPCDWGWMCNAEGCGFRTDERPCPEHAPAEVPALRLVECQAEPRHWLWAHLNDDYGHWCPDCQADRLHAEIVPLRHKEKLRVHRWCWLTNWVKEGLDSLRLMRITRWSSDCRYRWHVSARWRWTR